MPIHNTGQRLDIFTFFLIYSTRGKKITINKINQAYNFGHVWLMIGVSYKNELTVLLTSKIKSGFLMKFTQKRRGRQLDFQACTIWNSFKFKLLQKWNRKPSLRIRISLKTDPDPLRKTEPCSSTEYAEFFYLFISQLFIFPILQREVWSRFQYRGSHPVVTSEVGKHREN